MLSILRSEVPRAFKPLLAPARYKGVYGGRGGAKSHFYAEQIILRCYAQKTRVACIREVQNSIRDSVRQLLIDKIVKFQLEHAFDVTNTEIRCGESLIIFRGMQEYNADNIKSLEGFDIAWVEEAQTLSRRSLDMLRPTIRNPGSELWFSWNPRNKFDPVDEFFRGEHPYPGALALPVSWKDNPWFPDELRAEKDFDYAADKIRAEHVWGGGYEIVAEGAYYAVQMADAAASERIGKVPWQSDLPVHTAWDLGIGDSTAIWFAQQHMGEVRLIDYYESSGVGLEHYAKHLREKPYVYGEHILPHDVMVSDLSTGRTRYQMLASLGINARALEREGQVDDGINAVRMLLPRCWFDEKKCSRGIDALRLYRREYDEKLRDFKQRPLHDWTSHCADAFRYLARGLPDQSFSTAPRDRYARRSVPSGSWQSL